MRTRSRWPSIVAIGLGLGFATPALACGVCVLGMVDWVAPPALLWFFLPLSWFVLSGAVSSLCGVHYPLQPGVLLSAGLAIVAFLTGAAMLGPLATVPLLVPPLWAFASSALSATVTTSPKARTAVLGIGAAHLLLIATGVVVSIHTRATRTDAEYIASWGETALAISKFRALRAQEPGSLPSYRYIVEHGSGFLAAEASERIAEIGRPEEDDPILDRAVERYAADSDVAGRIVLAKRRLDERAGP